jgi:hypothetical protein
MDFLPTTPIRRLAVVAGVIGCGVVASASVVEMLQPVAVQAQNTPSLMEFRWEGDRNYRKLYYVSYARAFGILPGASAERSQNRDPQTHHHYS